MTREHIEKAAMLFAGAGEWGECPYNPDAKNGFMAGAEWRINSVWHDTTEFPKLGELIVVVLKSGHFTSWFVSRDIIDVFKRFGVKIWSYAIDLLPERKKKAE